jgi:PadR family transcriptional regulator PadR
MAPVLPQLFQGTLDVLILRSLSAGPRHGYAVAEWLEATAAGDLQIEDAALYTALHKMEARGWVISEWGLSDKGKRAKFYQLTSTGRAQLRSRVRAWERYVACVDRVLRGNLSRA